MIKLDKASIAQQEAILVVLGYRVSKGKRPGHSIVNGISVKWRDLENTITAGLHNDP